MPSLKRKRLGDSAGEGDECGASTRKKKKKKTTSGYYPTNLLGDFAAGVIPASFRGILGAAAAGLSEKSLSCTTKVCYSNGEAESNSKGGTSDNQDDDEVAVAVVGGKKDGVSRPALVRTSRGRVQVLPSRFNDSVMDDWRKDGTSSGYFEDEFERAAAPKTICKRKNGERNGQRPRRYATLCGEVLHKDSGAGSIALRKREVYVEDVGFVEVEEVDLTGNEEERKKKKEGLYGPEDFYAGDIVWAKARKKEPFWPAIVIDPTTQAPELVLGSCIADTACVMFLGYSGSENERVLTIDYFVYSALFIYLFVYFLYIWQLIFLKLMGIYCVLMIFKQDYAWVKYGMIFPFMDYVDRCAVVCCLLIHIL